MKEKPLSFDEQMERVYYDTKQLIRAAMQNSYPGERVRDEFGIDSMKHYESLCRPIREGEIEPLALEYARGHGQKLTMLVREATSNPHKDVVFYTAEDAWRERPPFDPSMTREKMEAEEDRISVELEREIGVVRAGSYSKTRDGYEHREDGIWFHDMPEYDRLYVLSKLVDRDAYLEKGLSLRRFNDAMERGGLLGPSPLEMARQAADSPSPSTEREMEP